MKFNPQLHAKWEARKEKRRLEEEARLKEEERIKEEKEKEEQKNGKNSNRFFFLGWQRDIFAMQSVLANKYFRDSNLVRVKLFHRNVKSIL